MPTHRRQDIHKDFPGFWTAVLILSLLIGIQIVMSIVAFDMGIYYESGDTTMSSAITVLSCGIVFSLLMAYKKIGYSELFNPTTNSIKSMIVLLTLPLLLTLSGALIWISDLTNLLVYLFPLTESESSMFSQMVGGGLASVVTTCIIAPFIEEMLFRGLILRSFLENYSSKKAILLSSLLFALFHLNIYQFPVAFFLGCLFGYLYLKSLSLWPSILAHSMYNSMVVILWNVGEYSTQEPVETAVRFNSFFVNVIALLSSIAGIMILAYILNLKTDRQNSRE